MLSGGQEAEYRKCFCKIVRHFVSGFIIKREWSGLCDYTVGKLRGDIQGADRSLARPGRKQAAIVKSVMDGGMD